MSARCRSCGALIEWARTESGKRAPFEADPAGRFVIGDDGIASYQPDAPLEVDRVTNHFSTCPQAGSWRTAR